jgi:cytoskeletal protein RodZ
MAAGAQFEEVRIGETLKRARTRAGLDIRTAEERTKIRIKYLRALESENWEAIPSPAYAKGFLRTYAGVLGLDPDALVDDYRRRGTECPVSAARRHRLRGAGGDRDPGHPRGLRRQLG